MLTAVLDRTDGSGAVHVRDAFEDVERRYAAVGLRVRWPVTAEIVPIPIMGATKSARGRHTLYVSEGALESRMLDGLIAHEMGHMLRTEERHPSHDPAVLTRMGRSLRFPRAGQPALGQAFNHVQDIYADDLAFLAGLDDRAYGFFAQWVRGNVRSRNGDRWHDLGLCVSNGFALGNLTRHGLLDAGDGLWAQARAFDRDAGMRDVDGFARFFASLPQAPKVDLFVEHVRTLASSMRRAHDGHRE